MDRDEAFQEALRHASDLDRRLTGENPDTDYVDDARHWEVVYRELYAFKLQVLNAAEEGGRTVPDGGQEEVGTDLTILRAEAERLDQRLRYWTSRREQLEARSV